MIDGKKIVVVVPCYNEISHIDKTIENIPSFVDFIIVVDDGSNDGTDKKLQNYNNEKIKIIKHKKNKGVGGAIISGYKKAIDLDADITAVMAGDGQMDPDDLHRIIEPVIQGKADYSKGNRLFYPDAKKIIPLTRFIGNYILTYLTRITSGYHNIYDSQCGYTAIKKETLKKLDLDKIYPRYGFPNDFLAHLNCIGAKVVDVTVKPVYNGSKSGIKPHIAIFTYPFILLRSFLLRLLRSQWRHLLNPQSKYRTKD